MKGGGKKRLALESPPNDAASSADANGGNGGDHGHSVPVRPIDRTLLLSGVAEETPIQESEEQVAETEVAEEGYEAAQEGERPKTELPDGFYEIEAIRRKRVRKGHKQYLIKWRDWPETATTWEPMENLQEVSDVIDAFEESIKSAKQGKSKCKQVVQCTQPKKRLQRSTTPYRLRHFTTSGTHNHQQSASFVDLGHADLAASPQAVLFAGEGENNGDASSQRKGKQPMENGSTSAPRQTADRREENDYDPKLNVHRATSSMNANGVDADRLAIDVQGANTSTSNAHMDGPSKVDVREPVQNDRCRGAKRRKSGPVKRFTKEPHDSEHVDAQRAIHISGGAVEQARAVVAGTAGNNAHIKQVEEPHVSEPVDTQRAINTSGGAVEQARAVVAGASGNNGQNNQVEEAEDNLTVVKIIKPIDYLPPLSSNKQEAFITFLALKSDGAEVVVSNQYLKASNPLLLVNYYEQHIRYSPA